jgi:sugar O-acyltransferase (sialic acid O-acetyltransferase NeuD family)
MMTMANAFAVSDALPVLFYGGTGQAIVNREILELQGGALSAVADDTVGLTPPFADVPLLCGWLAVEAWRATFEGPFGFAVCIGNPHGRRRLELARQLSEIGGVPLTLVHPSATIARDCILGAGSQIMAGAVLQPRVVLGAQCIVNTRAGVDHECTLGDGVEIGPGATLCGAIQLEAAAWVAAGATVLPRCRIGADAVVGAGSLVRHDVADRVTVVGVPAQPISREQAI